MHLGGNMLYLWIFGDNIERAIGAGEVPDLLSRLRSGGERRPYPDQPAVPDTRRRRLGRDQRRARRLPAALPEEPRPRHDTRPVSSHVPAIVVLGFWIVLQFINGIGSVARTEETAGVAYMAHIGGFVAGLVLVKLFVGRARTGALLR